MSTIKEKSGEIRRVLKEKIAPILSSHGGDIELVEVGDDGTVRVRLIGACSHCMGATETMEFVVATILKQEFPEITEVVTDDSVDEELLAEALKILRKNN